MQQISTEASHNSDLHRDISPITTIPEEILLKIFHEYYGLAHSLVILRLTCRSWSNLVTSAISLPRRIFLTDGCSCKEYCKPPGTHTNDYCCRSGSHLRQALELIQDAYFELTIYTPIIPSTSEVWGLLPWHKFRTQCIGISAHSGAYDFSTAEDPDLTVVPLLNCLPSLQNLQYLALHDNGTVTSSILSKIDRNSYSLKSMEVSCAPSNGGPFDPHSLRSMLSNLESFDSSIALAGEFSIGFSTALLSSFRNLKNLRWDGPSHDPEHVRSILETVGWRFTLDRLETCYSLLLGFPPHPTLSQLKELVVRASRDDEEHDQIDSTFELAHLTNLKLIGSWRGLVQISAPNLGHLALHGTWGSPPPVDEIDDLLETCLRPKRLDVHDDGYGFVLRPLLLQGSLASGVEELNMHVRSGWVEDGHLERFLVDLMADERKLCGHLRHLKVSAFPGDVSNGMGELTAMELYHEQGAFNSRYSREETQFPDASNRHENGNIGIEIKHVLLENILNALQQAASAAGSQPVSNLVPPSSAR
ncbi:hypothetical protein FRC17_000317 [Serendipita sp. 399]|nr:hypothetical protein FRC17_000317 [Serendipita sp. 399]